MRKRATTVLVSLLLMLMFTSLQLCNVSSDASENAVSQEIEEARARLDNAFNATLAAEREGANVDEVVQQLNFALNYTVQAETALSKGESEQAIFLAGAALLLCDEILPEVRNLGAQAETTRLMDLLATIAVTIALVFFGVFIFFYGRRFWRRRREDEFLNMQIKRETGGKIHPNKEADAEKEASEERVVIVAILAALIVVSGLLIYVSLMPPIPENFASVYILNSEGKADDLPELLVLGKNNTFSLRVGVENFMGRIEHGILYAKVADGTVLRETLPEVTVMSFERILSNRETWEFPTTLTLNEKGVYEVFFELWLYDETESVFVNSHVMSGLWLEVVAVA